MEYMEDGYLPEAMINFLVFLGWNPGTNREIFSMASLIQEFSAEGIQRSGASFASHKLDWINGFYLRAKSEEKLAELCIPYLNLKQSNSNYVTKEKETYLELDVFKGE